MDSISIDRRRVKPQSERDMKRLLNADQIDTLTQLELIGWTIRFVRRQDDGSSLAAVYNPDQKAIAIIEPDGRLEEKPKMAFRA
jgi:hypothetical protein